jgi:hypothetical protein
VIAQANMKAFTEPPLKFSNIQFNINEAQKATLKVQDATTKCDVFFNSLIDNIVKAAIELEEMFLFSGKGFNDIGNYDSCKALVDGYFLLGQVTPEAGKLLPVFNLGLCVPNECQTEE